MELRFPIKDYLRVGDDQVGWDRDSSKVISIQLLDSNGALTFTKM